MKIGINASFLRKRGTGIGEVTYHFVEKLCELKRQGIILQDDYDVILYVEEGVEINADAFDGIDVHVVMQSLYKRDDLIRKVLWEMIWLPQQIKKDGCNIFLSLYQCPMVLKNTRHVMIVHDLIPRIFPEYMDNWRKRLYQWLSERAVKQCDKIISVSEQTKKDIVKYLIIPEEKIDVQYIDCAPQFKRKYTEKEVNSVLKKYDLAQGYIYFGGGMDIRKNTEKLLQAYKKLRDNNENVPPLVISGKLAPDMAPLITDVAQIISDLELLDSVQVLGFVPDEDLPALYAGAQLFVYPSLYEGFGLPVLEAMAMGTPVVASDASSVPEVGGDAIEYFMPQDVDNITDVMQKVIKSEELRKDLRMRGKKQAEKFCWENFVKSTIQTIVKD